MRRSKILSFIIASLVVLLIFNLAQDGHYEVADSEYSRWLSEFRNGKPTIPVQVVVEFVDPTSRRKSERLELSSDSTGWDKLLRLLEIIESGGLLLHKKVEQPVLDIAVASASETFRGQVDMRQFSAQAEPALFLALVRESRRTAKAENTP